MKDSFREEMIVRDVVTDCHGEAWVFRRLGMDPNDTCTLAEAALKRGLSIEFLIAILDKTAPVTGVIVQGSGHSVQATLLDAIIEYVEEHHHLFLRSELPQLEQLLDKVIKAHYRSHGIMLGALKTVFLSFKTNIEEHLDIEEEILFPRLRNIKRHIEGRQSPVKASGRSSPISAIEEMQHEHEMLGWALSEMRELTSNYTPPDDTSNALTILYERLKKVEADLKEHVHLENDLLWPALPSTQAPEDVTIATDKGAPAKDKEDTMCPRSNQPCQEGSPAGCRKFWDCVRQAMQQRWAKTNESDNDGPAA